MYLLKHRPEDFVVEELARLDLKPSGSHLVVRVTKRGRNTEDVAELLADRLRIPRRDVGYAGAKDRNAVTTQHFSLKGATADDVMKVRIPDVAIDVLGFLDTPLGLGLLDGNRFVITVRNLEGDEDLALPRSIPNYFDEQRFGTHNAAIGRALVKKEFAAAVELVQQSDPRRSDAIAAHLEEHVNDYAGALQLLPKQLLRMYLHAFQSLLWNKALASYIRTNAKQTRNVAYAEGEFVFPHDDAVLPPMKLPMPGFGSPAHPLVDALLREEKLSPRDFIIRQLQNLSLEGTEREALLEVKDFSSSDLSEDEEFPGKKKSVLSFSLPKGSYATIVVKALLSVHEVAEH